MNAFETTSIPKNIQIPRIGNRYHIIRSIRTLFEKTSTCCFYIVEFQRYLRSSQNKSEFDTILGKEPCGQDENNAIVPARPSAKLDWSSSADGRAGRAFDPARPSAKLDWSSSAAELVARSIQLGHPPNLTDPPGWMAELPSAELAACSIQLVHPSSWTVVFSSGVRLFETYARELLPRECREDLREEM
ncbi:hypothetical protein YC2023_117220 [Brassica napus]